MEQIFEEAMRALLNAVGELGRKHPPEIWVTFFEHIAAYERLYRALLGRKGSPWFVRKMRASLAGLVKARGHLPHGPDASARSVHTFSDEFVPDLVSTMFVEAITWWLEHGRPYTPKEIATRPLADEEMVVCADEKTNLQPRPRLAATLPTRPDQPTRLELSY